jgi:hypothetical protein
VRASIEDFASAVRDFCAWAEASSETPPEPTEEAKAAIRFLAVLYSGALNLPSISTADEVPDYEVSYDDWKAVFARFGALPFNFYRECDYPFALEDDESSIGDVADDLADVYRDLRVGLSLFANGHEAAAISHWRETFEIHWGLHAVSALKALHHWIAVGNAKP